MSRTTNDVMDSREFRNIVGNFATGITVITTKSKETPMGFTANSFTSLSLEPKLVLFHIDKGSSNYNVFMETDHFAVNILANDQMDVSKQFAQKDVDRFAGIDYEEKVTGSPVLTGTLAYLDCKVVNRYDGGDHTIVIGEVVDVVLSETLVWPQLIGFLFIATGIILGSQTNPAPQRKLEKSAIS
ncbi:flavin reductase family protein [Aliibacillus thermotolerans]|uniref:Flavin reductase family protein n=1 Tax=Aliibacillus thermotolerans TaxID=1834418 RepID=A0ABW0U801_9BACI|nr:flavin reductase family protein [Aliibacillus thermotolerans]MDA3129975.1 flavin reductase [Aliibacillus thermotolerans]